MDLTCHSAVCVDCVQSLYCGVLFWWIRPFYLYAVTVWTSVSVTMEEQQRFISILFFGSLLLSCPLIRTHIFITTSIVNQGFQDNGLQNDGEMVQPPPPFPHLYEIICCGILNRAVSTK